MENTIVMLDGYPYIVMVAVGHNLYPNTFEWLYFSCSVSAVELILVTEWSKALLGTGCGF